MTRIRIGLAALAGSLVLAPLMPDAGPAAAGDGPRLRVDPRLLVEAEQVWDVIATPDNALWPGWDARSTPILIYLPGVQDVLLNHPKPPDGFVPYAGPLRFSGGPIALKDGPTLIEWDGQNTSRDVGGVTTLVIADTPSNLRQKVRGWLSDPRPVETRLAELDLERDFVPDVYGEMAMIAHEAFHVFQSRSAPDKGADERDVRVYPCLSVENNVGFALEGRALAEGLRAADDRAARAAALRWLAIREDRRAHLPARAIAYEDANEYMEGLAMYVELRLVQALAGRPWRPALEWSQGFRGVAGLADHRERRIRGLLENMRGEANVNNDPYGTSPLRRRLYFSGMAIASLLDRFAPGWQAKIFGDGVTLTGLATAALAPTARELRAAREAAASDPERPALVRAKTRLAEAGRRDADSLYAAIAGGPGTTVTIDYSALGTDRVGLGFTPFGVRALDSLRTIYTLVPIAADIGSSANGFEQSIPMATFEDRGAHRFMFRLEAPLSAPELDALLGPPHAAGSPGGPLDVRLPGVRLYAQRATAERAGGGLLLRYHPAP